MEQGIANRMRIKTIWVYLGLKINFVNEVLTQRRRVERGYRLKALGYRMIRGILKIITT